MDPTQVKTFVEEHLAQERPLDLIVGLLKVQFQENSPKFLGFGFMHDFLKGENTLMDVTPSNKRRLSPTNHAVSDR